MISIRGYSVLIRQQLSPKICIAAFQESVFHIGCSTSRPFCPYASSSHVSSTAADHVERPGADAFFLSTPMHPFADRVWEFPCWLQYPVAVVRATFDDD